MTENAKRLFVLKTKNGYEFLLVMMCMRMTCCIALCTTAIWVWQMISTCLQYRSPNLQKKFKTTLMTHALNF